MKKLNRKQRFKNKHLIVRKKISGTLQVPRLCIYKGNRSLISQIIDDTNHKTLCYSRIYNKTTKGIEQLADDITNKAKSKKITKIVFDRSGYAYIGKVKLFAELCRKKGLEF